MKNGRLNGASESLEYKMKFKKNGEQRLEWQVGGCKGREARREKRGQSGPAASPLPPRRLLFRMPRNATHPEGGAPRAGRAWEAG